MHLTALFLQLQTGQCLKEKNTHKIVQYVIIKVINNKCMVSLTISRATHIWL